MIEKRFTLKKGDNGFYLIFNKDKFFLAMKYKDEAQVVVDYLNLNEIGYNYMQRKCMKQKDLIDKYKWKIWELRQQLKDNGIEEDLE